MNGLGGVVVSRGVKQHAENKTVKVGPKSNFGIGLKGI